MTISELEQAEDTEIPLSAGDGSELSAPVAGDPMRDGWACFEALTRHWPAVEQTRSGLQAENERLQKAAKLQAELVASVAHEMRTPLCSVLGFTDLLLKQEFEPEKRQRCLQIINSEMRRLARLIDDLFEAHLAVEEDSLLTLELFDLGELLSEQVDLFRMQSDAHELRLSLPMHSLLVRADRERIAQVIANLLSNAIKYSPDGGLVVVGAESHEGTVRISVQDNGLGIPTEQQHLVFGRFFRADTSQMTGIEGTGLGLALLREIVHAHGGAVGFDSTYGRGSTFWFELRGTRR